MDISKWLEETEQPQFAPDSPRRKHPRRRARSDSSFVEPLSPKPPSCQQEVREESASEAYPAPPSDCSKSSRYARKPRRKTRPERYEPNVHQHRGRKTSPKKARHKSTRKRNEKPGVVVQSFRAKNVSGDRLTLKPPELGLFNKGRASMAVRGRGLPDLVFSEMKFLQQHNHSPKPPPQPDVAEKKRKKDHIQTREGEISAFFTCERLAPIVQAEKRPSCQDSRQETKRRHRDQGSMTDVVVPTVELADRDAFVAFGNRRPRHDSTSYVSWSESIRAPSTTPARLQADYDNMSVRHDSDRHKQYKSKIDGEEGSPNQPVLLSAVKQSTGGVAERFKVSSLVPSRSDVSRSHSCPQYSSSPRRAMPVNQAEKPQSADAACLPSSTSPASPAHVTVDADPRLSANRSNTTKHGISPNFNKKAHPHKRHQIVDDDYNGWEESLEPSSDLGKVLQECKDTFQEQYRAASSQTRHAARPEPLLLSPSTRRQDRTVSHPSTRRMPSVRFAEQPRQYQILPSIAGPSIYEQQEQRRYPCLKLYESEDVGVDPEALEQEYMVEYGGLYYDDDDGWDGMAAEPMAHGLEDDKEMYLAGSAFAADDVSEDSRRGNGVVAPGFWRPNKLY